MDVFVVRLTASGEVIWTQSLGDSDPAQAASQSAWAVSVDGTGQIVIAGQFSGVMTNGAHSIDAQGGAGMFVLALDPGAYPLWIEGFGGPETEQVLPFAVATAPDGSVYVGGGFRGKIALGGPPKTTEANDASNLFLLGLDKDGHYNWSRAAGDAQPQQTFDLAVSPSGDLFAVGGVVGSVDLGAGVLTSAGEGDVFIAGYAPNSEVRWVRVRGSGAPVQFATGIAIDPRDETIVIAGPNNGTLDLGSGTVSPATDIDPFVAKIPTR